MVGSIEYTALDAKLSTASDVNLCSQSIPSLPLLHRPFKLIEQNEMYQVARHRHHWGLKLTLEVEDVSKTKLATPWSHKQDPVAA